MAVYENVEKIREALGVTKTSLATALNLSVMGYSHMVRNDDKRTQLDVERLRIIAEAMKVDPAIFFDDKLTDNVITNIVITDAR